MTEGESVGALESDVNLVWVAGDDGSRQSDGAGPAKWRGSAG